MKNKPWLRALIIIMVPVALVLTDKFIIKSGYRAGTLWDAGMAIMLLLNLVFYIKTNLLKRFFSISVGLLIYLIITCFGPKSDKSILQELLSNLVILLVIAHMVNFPNKTIKERSEG
jgi:hypothetical protein